MSNQALREAETYREQVRDILDPRQFSIVSAMLAQWCTNVMRSKVKPIKQVAAIMRAHFDGIVNWARSRQTSAASSKSSTDCSRPPNERRADTPDSKQ
jgi:hypothetical protein